MREANLRLQRQEARGDKAVDLRIDKTNDPKSPEFDVRPSEARAILDSFPLIVNEAARNSAQDLRGDITVPSNWSDYGRSIQITFIHEVLHSSDASSRGMNGRINIIRLGINRYSTKLQRIY